jgi:hypothetical protein
MSHDGVSNGRRAGAPSAERARAGQRCDFCGARVPVVRRVALDQDYDRLQTPHRELYACDPCSERKEQRRLGLEGS